MELSRTKSQRILIILGIVIILVSAACFFYFFSQPNSQQIIIRNKLKAPKGMVWIPPGEFLMGSNSRLAKNNEKPAHKVRVDGFWIDKTDVTNAQFAAFVKATGYKTTAEFKPDWETLKVQLPAGTPKPPNEKLVPGAMVFIGTSHAVPLDDASRWWRFVPGANWRHPQGPQSNITNKDDHPVVQVSYYDALAYAKWVGKRLPTEAEWEYAARGGLTQADYIWGDEFRPKGKRMANTFAGDQFPIINPAYQDKIGTTKVASYPPNGYGLYDMSGNVWQWVSNWYRADSFAQQAAGPLPINPQGPTDSFEPSELDAPANAPRRVIRGGSFLCDENFCTSYRPSARRGVDPYNPMSHIGFRLVMTQQIANK